MYYESNYKLITGDKTTIEKQMNDLAKQDYVWCGNIVATPTNEGIEYAMLLCKTTQINTDKDGNSKHN